MNDIYLKNELNRQATALSKNILMLQSRIVASLPCNAESGRKHMNEIVKLRHEDRAGYIRATFGESTIQRAAESLIAMSRNEREREKVLNRIENLHITQ